MERCISKLQETVYRLVHHEFGGKTVAEAAMALEIPETAVERLLAEMEEIAPQLFPLIPRADWSLWNDWLELTTVPDLAVRHSLSERTVNYRIAKIKKLLDYTKPPTKTELLGWRDMDQVEFIERF